MLKILTALVTISLAFYSPIVAAKTKTKTQTSQSVGAASSKKKTPVAAKKVATKSKIALKTKSPKNPANPKKSPLSPIDRAWVI